MRFLTRLLFLVFSLQEILAQDFVTVNKCCPVGMIYNSADKRCVQGADMSIIGKTIEVTTKKIPDPLTSDSVNPLENLDLQAATLKLGSIGTPGCKGLDHETHTLDAEDSVLTVDGKLIVSKYENGIGENPGDFTTDFCVDLDANNNNQMIAVMCDICKSVSKVCFDLCCPHGYHFIGTDPEDPEEISPFICGAGSKADFSKVDIWSSESNAIPDWRQNSDQGIVIVAPKVHHIKNKNIHGYTCPSGDEAYGLGNDLDFKIHSDGKLGGSNKSTKVESFWRREDFCLAFIDGNPLIERYDQLNDLYDAGYDHSEFSGDESVLRFFGCSEGVDLSGKSNDIDDWCQEFKAKTHPVFFIVSTVFLIITLFVYLAEDSLRGSNVLFSRITMGFIINLTIALILFTVEAMKEEDDRETHQCKAKGYLTLYFFLAFYCWMNAMCFNIWNKFASMQRQSLDDRKKFIRYLIYAQGLPLAITFFVLIVDEIGQSKTTKMDDQKHLPNMGRYSCYIGNGILGVEKSYFGHPIFIYFQSFMLIMQGANMYFLASTGVTIRNAFKRKHERVEDKKEKYKLAKREFNTIAKLGVIMGVFWIGEFISTAIEIEWCSVDGCHAAICYTQLVLDIPNLLAGFLIFLVTVFKKPVYLGLRKKATELTSGVWKTQDRTGVSIYSDSGTEMKSVS